MTEDHAALVAKMTSEHAAFVQKMTTEHAVLVKKMTADFEAMRKSKDDTILSLTTAKEKQRREYELEQMTNQ